MELYSQDRLERIYQYHLAHGTPQQAAVALARHVEHMTWNRRIDEVTENAKTQAGVLVIIAALGVDIGLGYLLGAGAGWIAFALQTFVLAVATVSLSKRKAAQMRDTYDDLRSDPPGAGVPAQP